MCYKSTSKFKYKIIENTPKWGNQLINQLAQCFLL